MNDNLLLQLFFPGANEPQYNWTDITDNFTEAASGKTKFMTDSILLALFRSLSQALGSWG